MKMRIWHVVGEKEYWLQPEWSEGKTGRLTVYGCRLYDADEHFRGYWRWDAIPMTIQKNIKERVRQSIDHRKREERRQRSAGVVRFLEDEELPLK